MKKYNPGSEYKINISDNGFQNKFMEAMRVFEEFVGNNGRKIDLENKETIDNAYEHAKNKGIFPLAESIRNLVFGKDIHFYGVVYLWDACINYCVYCPGSILNKKKAFEEGKKYPARELSVEQCILETKKVMEWGHKHVCFLSGSSPGRERFPQKIIPYLRAIDRLGLDEIILNIEPLSKEGMQLIRSAVQRTPLQFRVFQETYNEKTYSELHPGGPKADYNFRIMSQARALEAGFDNVGLGVLFGLYRFPLEEIQKLRYHANFLKTRYGKSPARVCLPSANELKKIHVEIPYVLEKGKYSTNRQEIVEMGTYEKLDELIYALARLSMPTVSIVSSERDEPAMLKILDKYATCTTLNVHSGIGANTGIFRQESNDEVHFEQTTDYPRYPLFTIKDMKMRGYNPILNSFPSITKNA